MHTVKSTCCYCGTGCGVEIDAEGDAVLAIRGDASHPANFGRLCTKGLTLPFMSYGGSAILLNLIAIAVVLRVDYENKLLMKGGRV